TPFGSLVAHAAASTDCRADHAEHNAVCRIHFVGLLLAPKAGIEMPVLQRWCYGRATPLPTNAARLPLLAGMVVAALLLVIFYAFFLPRIPEWPIGLEAAMPIWKRVLACLYGAINEEIVARLFALSLLDRKSTRLNSSHYQPSRMPS